MFTIIHSFNLALSKTVIIVFQNFITYGHWSEDKRPFTSYVTTLGGRESKLIAIANAKFKNKYNWS